MFVRCECAGECACECECECVCMCVCMYVCVRARVWSRVCAGGRACACVRAQLRGLGANGVMMLRSTLIDALHGSKLATGAYRSCTALHCTAHGRPRITGCE